jgi:hypothetical protein
MKRLALISLIVLAGCVHSSSNDREPRIAGCHIDQASYTAAANTDSLTLEEQNRHGEWMVKTFYSLKQIGYSAKRTWIYIDSATRSIYNDSIPHWYADLKKQTDSSIRDKKIYRRVPLR